MRKFGIILFAAIWMVVLFTSPASAALTNSELQASGGLVCVNSSDTFFFSPTGEADEWGLYAVSTYADGPISVFSDAKPARMLYADSKKVYFLAMKSNGEYLLGSVSLSDGKLTNELDGIAGAFAESETSMFFVPSDDLYTLSRYNFTTNSSTKLKTMTSKTIYDAGLVDGGVYFLGMDSGNKLVIYEINKKSGKAVNMSNPSPSMGDGYLYGKYFIYHQKGDQTKIYAVPLGSTKGVQLGEKVVGISLSSPRFGQALYPYDSSANAIVRVPLDGSATSSLAIGGDKLTNYLIGGTSEKIYYWDSGAIYSVNEMLQGKSEVASFDIDTAKMKWTYLSSTNQDYLLIMGYMPITYADYGVTLPTAIRLVNESTGETVFQYPPEEAAPIEETGDLADTESGATDSTLPSAGLIDTPQDILIVEEVGEDEDVSFADLIGGN